MNGKPELFWGVSNDAVFTVSATLFVALFVFFAGIMLDRLRASKRERERLNRLKTYFFLHAKPIPRTVSTLASEYQKLADDFADPKTYIYSLPESHQLNLDNIGKISHQDIFTSLVGMRKRADVEKSSLYFKNIFDTFEFLKYQCERARTNFDNFMTDVKKYLDVWNTNLDLLDQRFHELLSLAKAQNRTPPDDPFLEELDRIFHKWTQADDFINIFIADKHLLIPLLEFCQNNSDDLRVTLFRPIGIKLQKAHSELKITKEQSAKSFRREADQLEKQKTTFEEAMTYFQAIQ